MHKLIREMEYMFMMFTAGVDESDVGPVATYAQAIALLLFSSASHSPQVYIVVPQEPQGVANKSTYCGRSGACSVAAGTYGIHGILHKMVSLLFTENPLYIYQASFHYDE